MVCGVSQGSGGGLIWVHDQGSGAIGAAEPELRSSTSVPQAWTEISFGANVICTSCSVSDLSVTSLTWDGTGDPSVTHLAPGVRRSSD